MALSPGLSPGLQRLGAMILSGPRKWTPQVSRERRPLSPNSFNPLPGPQWIG